MSEIDSSRQAALTLSKRYTETCTRFLAALESGPKVSRLTEKDCFELWSKLGALKHDRWFNLFESEREGLKNMVAALLERITSILNSRRKEFSDCLESGISNALGKAEDSRREVEHFLKKKEISSTLTSYELNSGLLFWRDQLGFALLLANTLDLQLSSKVKNRIERLDSKVKKILPEILGIYRARDDDPTPYPERFPESFWWRQLR